MIKPALHVNTPISIRNTEEIGPPQYIVSFPSQFSIDLQKLGRNSIHIGSSHRPYLWIVLAVVDIEN